MAEQRYILKCCRCKKLFSINEDRWKTLLKRWGSAINAEKNYICKKCELPSFVGPDDEEKVTTIEQELLSHTIDGRPFQPSILKTFLKRVSVARRIKDVAKVMVVSEKDLERYYNMYLELKAKQKMEEEQKIKKQNKENKEQEEQLG